MHAAVVQHGVKRSWACMHFAIFVILMDGHSMIGHVHSIDSMCNAYDALLRQSSLGFSKKKLENPVGSGEPQGKRVLGKYGPAEAIHEMQPCMSHA